MDFSQEIKIKAPGFSSSDFSCFILKILVSLCLVSAFFLSVQGRIWKNLHFSLLERGIFKLSEGSPCFFFNQECGQRSILALTPATSTSSVGTEPRTDTQKGRKVKSASGLTILHSWCQSMDLNNNDPDSSSVPGVSFSFPSFSAL